MINISQTKKGSMEDIREVQLMIQAIQSEADAVRKRVFVREEMGKPKKIKLQLKLARRKKSIYTLTSGLFNAYLG